MRLISVFAYDFERPVLDVLLDCGIVQLATDKSLGIENGVVRIHGRLILRGVTDQTLRLGESNPGGCGSVALIVGNNFDALILPDSDAGICSAEVNTNGWPVNLLRIQKRFASGIASKLPNTSNNASNQTHFKFIALERM